MLSACAPWERRHCVRAMKAVGDPRAADHGRGIRLDSASSRSRRTEEAGVAKIRSLPDEVGMRIIARLGVSVEGSCDESADGQEGQDEPASSGKPTLLRLIATHPRPRGSEVAPLDHKTPDSGSQYFATEIEQ